MAELGLRSFPHDRALQSSAISYRSRLRRRDDGPYGNDPTPGIRGCNDWVNNVKLLRSKGVLKEELGLSSLLMGGVGVVVFADDGVGVAVVSARPRAAGQRGYLSGVGYAGEITGRAETTRTPALEDATTGLTM